MSHAEIKKKLASSRKDLLDIGLRNTMINFRSGPRSLAIVDERSEQILQLLYRQNKAMTFVPAPEKGTKGGKETGNSIVRTDSAQDTAAGSGEDREEVDAPAQDAATIALVEELDGADWPDEDVAGGDIARQHTDTKLQTILSEERLFLSLLKIHTEAQTFIQEQGVNILFLALGFLHWYEAESSDKLRKAPLLLVPVELSRTGTRDVFRLRYSDDDLIQNLSLAAKLKTDFALDLPQYMADANADASEMPGTESFYEAVSGCVSKQPRWKVVPDEIHLGFFSFGKFLMFNDLDEAVWPEDKRPSEHPVLGRLLGEGFSNEAAFVAEDTHLDTIIEPGEVRFVRDADSSQTMAILEAREGRNLVIQGPPGTGKSQTITNIIAELLASSKKVLFVAEKMAALEVVKRRLDECHLGDAVLELHSHKATKQSVVRELERTLQQGRPLAADGTDDLAALKEVRNELNAYCEAVNTAIGASTIPFITALGHYLRIKRKHESLPVWSFEPMKAWSQRDHTRIREKVAELAHHLRENGRPSLNTFYGTACTTFSPVEQTRVTEELKHAITVLSRLLESAGQLAAHLGLERPATLQDVDVICRTARRAAEAPPLIGVRLDSAVWQTGPESIRALVAAGRMMASARSAHDGMLIEQAWEQDLLTERQHLAQLGEKWWRVFSGAYRRARARLQGLCKKPLPKDNASTLALVDGILGYQLSRRTYDQHLALGEALFGAQWMGERSDWDVLGRSSEWVIGLHDDMGKGQLPAGIVGFLAGHPDAGSLGTSIGAIHAAASDLRARVTTIIDLLGFARNRPASTLLDSPCAELREQLSTWLEAVPTIYETIRFNALHDELAALGLPEVAQAAADWERDADDLVHAFDYSWYAGLVAQAYGASPALARFDRIKQAHLIDRFRHLDQLSLGHAQAGLAKRIWEIQPRLSDPGEMAVVRNEANKKRRLMPIRQLMEQAGRAVQAIKPVFMMSPMSIASFLPPGKVEFDVVIFDEASQVKAVDAFGALLRGRQAIVVGDTRQMPPTDFFGRDVEVDEEDNVTADIESVLSLFRARGAQERYLSWHYRSRHESLIAVSNVEFYERRLTIFPSSGTNALATGLEMVCLPHALYDRGRTRTNREEARAVAQAVMDHATTHPGLSLGVVAFSVAQRDLIQVELELLRRKSPGPERFFTEAHPTEPFFVKNLENVQGDERDRIFISIGYGRNESGRIAKEFGPLNREGGERRLNVLISRAKMGMTVFSNFRGEELDLDETASHGVRALKHFLKYAETRVLDIPRETGRTPDSPFELEVMSALQARGYRIEPQVGTAGYFIDMAVKDPELPGRYVLAIECDGAAYHSSRSARDRDRLRQGVLEGLGWIFHRIWSTDWFRDPGRELDRAVAAIEAARALRKAARPVQPAIKPVNAPLIERAQPDEETTSPSVATYRKAVLPPWKGAQAIHEVAVPQLADLIQKVAAIEAPVHEAEVTRRLMEAFGVSRAGSRITQAVSRAVEHGVRSGLFNYAGGFLHTQPRGEVQARSRSTLAPAERRIEWVSPEELDVALLQAIQAGFSMDRDAAITSALEALGFGRASANIAGALGEQLDTLLATGRIRLVDDRYAVA
ncbi:DUF3320 domain-containing protein [Aromatoleum bremense]|uniref:DUF3320 domain-containing protein n=1 Tax=Aromatoleum bremense TaxID=76115 RepID=A0ABX1NU74_9RHOO|nr:DUF3320 domain-containing protein [Aromatoleum bremense]NMG15458.1 DUF3320 domain-containing protein [Aromatoleum bremense]QTQ30326.1 putative protein DUf4011 and DUF3320 [Aromatoleum bremense]